MGHFRTLANFAAYTSLYETMKEVVPGIVDRILAPKNQYGVALLSVTNCIDKSTSRVTQTETIPATDQ